MDGDRRRDHRQQHHGQHLLSRAFVEVAGARTMSFHLGTEISTIDLDREVSEGATQHAESRANEVVWEARPVVVRTLTAAEARALGVEPPEGAGEEVRIVEAEGFDRQACGGTHPRSTAEVGVVLVLGHERYKGGSRVRFVCGHRALAASRERNHVLDVLSRTLSTPWKHYPKRYRVRWRGLPHPTRIRELQEQGLEAEARRLLSQAAPPPRLS